MNILDWKSWERFPLSPDMLRDLSVPTLVVCGGASPAAMQRAGGVLAASIPHSAATVVQGAAHFMIATHAGEVAQLIARHIER